MEETIKSLPNTIHSLDELLDDGIPRNQTIGDNFIRAWRIINNDKRKYKICSHLDELEIDNKCFMSETYDKISKVQHQIDKLMKKTKN